MNYDYCMLATTTEKYDPVTGESISGTQRHTAVAFLAPLNEVNVVLKNRVFVADRKAGLGSIAKDRSIIRHEITLRGVFIDSADMPPDFRAAVQRNFGRGVVTAEMQILRLQTLALHAGGHYTLKLGNDYYSAMRDRDLVYTTTGNRFPQVVFGELRREQDTNPTRIGYAVRFVAGFERAGGEQDQE